MKATVKVNKLVVKRVGIALVAVGLFILGVGSVLTVQDKVASIKAEGVAEFKLNSCDVYANDKGQKWFECDYDKKSR